MFEAKTVQEQYTISENDRLRILIVGAGIAGITAAQMLRNDGYHPVLIERNRNETHPGYMLALMPMVDTVLDDLGIRNKYRDHSVAFSRYGLHKHDGELLREDSMAAILNRFGEYRGIARGELLEVLTSAGCAVAFHTIVTEIKETAEAVMATFKTGEAIYQLPFDLIIIADGIHSHTRRLVLGKQAVDMVDTHWGGWVVWAPADDAMDLGEELWGDGFFYGVYPVKDHLGVFLGGNIRDTTAGPKQFVDRIRGKLKHIDARMESCLHAVAYAEEPFFWELNDCRCPRWTFGKVLLLGDAAAGFLPTAGIGAGMAMESAWVLTRMLRYADKQHIAQLLQAYENAQRPRVEAAQGNSRQLARMMFRQSKLWAILREWIMRLVSIEMALKPIQKLLANQPDPDHLAQQALKK